MNGRVHSVRSGQFPSPLEPPLLFFSAPQKQRPLPPSMDSHQGRSSRRAIASSMPIVEEASISIPASQANQFSTANPFANFRSIENIPPASQPQQAIASSQHVAQHQQKSFSSIQRSIQLPGSQFDGSPHDAQMIGMTNNAPESSNVQLALGLQPPSHTSFPEHDYAALVAEAPDITNFLDSFPGHLQGMKLVRDPPDLDTWRNILFHVDEMITLSEEQYGVSQAPLE